MLQNEALVAKIGFDTAENEPSKVCRYQPSIPPTVINTALMTSATKVLESREKRKSFNRLAVASASAAGFFARSQAMAA